MMLPMGPYKLVAQLHRTDQRSISPSLLWMVSSQSRLFFWTDSYFISVAPLTVTILVSIFLQAIL